MSIEKRRAREKQARIEAIKKSAWNIFLRDGFRNAKIAEIAKGCSLGLATLYYYFKDKRQIVYSLMLDYKQENHAEVVELLKQGISYRQFIKVYIDSALNQLDHFKFFVLADSYYNFHHEYDLSDPVIREYDRITRKNGDYILECLSAEVGADKVDRIRVIISMILGFLRRYVLLPQKSWPSTNEQEESMLRELLDLVYLMLADTGIDIDAPVPIPKNSE